MTNILPFLKLMLRHWKLLSIGMLLALITIIAGTALLAVSGWFISAAAFAGLTLSASLAFNFYLPAAVVRALAIIRIVSRYGERVLSHEATFHILSQLRVWLYQHLLPLMPGYLLVRRSSDLLARMVNDVEAMDHVYLRIVSPLVVAVIVLALLCAVLHAFSINIAWTVFVLMIVIAIVLPALSYCLARKPGEQQAKMHSVLRAHSVEFFQGLTALLCFNAAKQQINALAADDQALHHAQRQMASNKAMTTGLITLLSGITVWVAMYLGIPLVHLHQLNGANLALIALLIFGAFEAIMPLTLAFQAWRKTAYSAKRLTAIAKEKPAIEFVPSSVAQPQNAQLCFDKVSIAYRTGHPVIDDFSLTINPGERIAIVGPTGCGKTSIINSLLRFIPLTSGSISLGGVSIDQLTEADLRRMITLVDQRPHVFNGTIANNLRIAKTDATEQEMHAALASAQLDEFIAKLDAGLDTWVGEGGKNLSGGQARRLVIARALLHDAPIVILDEPTEGLDSITAQKVMRSLNSLMQNRSVILISHKPQDVAALVERIVVL